MGARAILQRELARMLGIGRDTLSSWESGMRKPQKRMWARVAAFLEAHRDGGESRIEGMLQAPILSKRRGA